MLIVFKNVLLVLLYTGKILYKTLSVNIL